MLKRLPHGRDRKTAISDDCRTAARSRHDLARQERIDRVVLCNEDVEDASAGSSFQNLQRGCAIAGDEACRRFGK
jgi:hypothetical protein